MADIQVAKKVRPIIFNGDMVGAILDGHKSQTRRVIKPQPKSQGMKSYGEAWEWKKGKRGFSGATLQQLIAPYGLLYHCPYGKTGDRLWVRETFAIETNFNLDSNEAYPPPFKDGRPINWVTDEHYGDHWEQCHYRATDPTPALVYEDYSPDYGGGYGKEPTVRWKPSIHMPRWASRITLEITGVRVERVYEITVGALIAEGIIKLENAHIETYPLDLIVNRSEHYTIWKKVWDSIYAKRGYPFSDNPWVWVLEFELANE